MTKLFANSGDPDQTLHSAVFDLGLHWFPSTLLRVPDYNGLISGSLLPLIQQFLGTSTHSEKDLFKFYDKYDKK